MKHVEKAMIFMIDKFFIHILKKLAFLKVGTSKLFTHKISRTTWLCAALVYLQLKDVRIRNSIDSFQ